MLPPPSFGSVRPVPTTVAAALVALLGVACTDAEPDDSAAPEVTEETSSGLECDTLEIRVTGDDPPQVGDAWTVWLWCHTPEEDEVLLTGTTRLIFDPADIASVSTNNAEFLHAGDATVMVQVGSRRESRDVTVSE